MRLLRILSDASVVVNNLGLSEKIRACPFSKPRKMFSWSPELSGLNQQIFSGTDLMIIWMFRTIFIYMQSFLN